MRHLTLVAALCAASAAHGAPDLTFGFAQGLSAVRDPHGSDLGIAAAFDLGTEHRSPGRVLTFGLSGEVVGGGDASGATMLAFADRAGGSTAALDLSHQRLDEGGFDPVAILSSPRSITRGRFEFGRGVGSPIDWAVAGAFSREGSPDGAAVGRSLSGEIGVSPRPAQRVALEFGQDHRSFGGAEARYEEMSLKLQLDRPHGGHEAHLTARTTPGGVRLETAGATTRALPRGGAMNLQIGLAHTAEGSVLPIGEADLRFGLSRQSRIAVEAGHHVIDDPLRGEIGNLRIDLSAQHRPTRQTSVQFSLGAFHREPLSGSDTDTGIRASAGISRTLTRDWSLAAELEHRRLDTERSTETRRSELSVMLERRIGGRGF